MSSETQEVSNQDYVRIFDTTLRDGEQAPGCTMNADEKVTIAVQLAQLGVSVIEAGFAAAKAGEPEAIRAVVAAVGRDSFSPVILSLARPLKSDIDAAVDAVKDAAHPGIHLFIGTSDSHLQDKLQMTFEAALQQMVEAVEYAKQFVSHIEVSAEDATRTPVPRLVRFYKALIQAGATVCNVPDTTGYATVDEYRALFRRLLRRARVCLCNKSRPCHHVMWSAHTHDDLGLATAKSLAAVQGGARQVECTLLGIGERCGNASLEQVVMALDTRRDRFGIATHIRREGLYQACLQLSRTIGQPISPTKPIVGANAFAHEAGIHQDGVLKDPGTYEIMRPADVGRLSNTLVLGKHSGQAAVLDRLRLLGVDLEHVQLHGLMSRFKDLAGAKRDGEVDDAELLSLLDDGNATDRYVVRFVFGKTSFSPAHRAPSAQVYLVVDGHDEDEDCLGDGIIDAAFEAIQSITGVKPDRVDCSFRALGRGADAVGEVVVTLWFDGLVVHAAGAHTDVTMAAVRAYIAAMNKLDRLIRFRTKAGADGATVAEPTP